LAEEARLAEETRPIPYAGFAFSGVMVDGSKAIINVCGNMSVSDAVFTQDIEGSPYLLCDILNAAHMPVCDELRKIIELDSDSAKIFNVVTHMKYVWGATIGEPSICSVVHDKLCGYILERLNATILNENHLNKEITNGRL
jgi:hypothetical protein